MRAYVHIYESIWFVTCPEFETKTLPSATKSIHMRTLSRQLSQWTAINAQFFLLVVVMRLVTP